MPRFSYINYVNRKTSTKKVSFDIKMDPSNIILEDSVDGDNDDCNRKQVKVSPTKIKSLETKKRLILWKPFLLIPEKMMDWGQRGRFDTTKNML